MQEAGGDAGIVVEDELGGDLSRGGGVAVQVNVGVIPPEQALAMSPGLRAALRRDLAEAEARAAKRAGKTAVESQAGAVVELQAEG